MAEATIPVDLRNPGQVFACLGLMEAAEVLCGSCEGGFGYTGLETSTTFTLAVRGTDDPVERALAFLAAAEVTAEAPRRSGLSLAKWKIPSRERDDATFPGEMPDSPATLPACLSAEGKTIPIEHWLDGGLSGRDNVKFWAGQAGYPGAALANDALDRIRRLGHNEMAVARADPFSVQAPQSSSFRFDWRRDYIPMAVGFSPNRHSAITMVGFPLAEILAAVGMQNARPERRDKLLYRYGASNVRLPIVFARAVLGAQNLGFPTRIFRMRLGWPGQEGQARCIIDAEEEAVR